MEILVALVVIALAMPLAMFAAPLFIYIVPLIVIGLVISYVRRGHKHDGRLWHLDRHGKGHSH